MPLMLRIFNDKVVTALHIHAAKPSNYEVIINGTRLFIETVLTLWTMLNVKHPLKGRNLRDANADPIRAIDDHQLKFFESAVLWLDVWEAMCDKKRSLLFCS